MNTIKAYPTGPQAHKRYFYLNGKRVLVLTTHGDTCTIEYVASKQISIVRLDRLEKRL